METAHREPEVNNTVKQKTQVKKHCASIYHPVHVCTLNKQDGEWTLEMDQLTGLLHSAVCAEREHLISHRTHAIKAQAIGE